MIGPPEVQAPPRPDIPVPRRPDLFFLPVSPRRARSRWLHGGRLLALLLVGLMVAGPIAVAVGHERPEDYAFIASTDGDPYRWNPCAPIHYVINFQDAPPGALQDVTAVATRVNAATGIELVYDGPTDELPSRSRSAYQPDRYGERWAPVLIAWVSVVPGDDSEWSRPGTQFAGLSTPLAAPGTIGVYVSGWIVINAEQIGPPGFDFPDDEGPVLQHEFGHVIGLGHTSEWGELMNFSGGGVTNWGPGDLEGLTKLGRDEGCLRTPAVP